MGANPMQKMKRNSMLSGLVIGLVIGLILCVVLYVFLTKTPGVGIGNKEEAVAVSLLNKSIKSGNMVTPADITTVVMNKSNVPTDAITLTSNAVAKIDLLPGTVLGASMLNQSGTTLTADLREQEYNMVSLPSKLSPEDFIDISLQLPNGADYIVISKKQVLNCDSKTIWLEMNEEEILTMSNAIIEYYIMAGSKLYATIYSEPGSQEASTPTYCPNSAVVSLINGNKNITSQITDGEGRFSEALKNIRNNTINKELDNYKDDKLSNIETNLQEEIDALQASRDAFFGALNSVD